jgi:hypothetical protein
MNKGLMNTGKSFLTVNFLVPAIILAVWGIAGKPAVMALSKYYAKEPISIRKPLRDFDILRLPSFQSGWSISHRSAQPKEIGTEEYVDIVLTPTSKSENLPQQAELFITYYSDPRDKVPHTPEVCSRQAGAIVREMSTIAINMGGLLPEYDRLKVRSLKIEQLRHKTVDIYVFCVEGKFKYNREQVRWALGKPGNKHVYFSKIEAAAICKSDSNSIKAMEISKKLLSEALPILVSEYFPTKEQIRY